MPDYGGLPMMSSTGSGHRIESDIGTSRSEVSSDTFDSGYGSCYKANDEAPYDSDEGSSDSEEASYGINYNMDVDLAVLVSKATRRSARKVERKRLYIHVENLMTYVQKKRRLDLPEDMPHVQLPRSDNSLNTVAEETDLVNTNRATRNPEVADAQTQTNSEVSSPKSVVDQSSEAGDSEDSHNSNYSDEDDDDDLIHSVASPQHKLDLLHMLGYDTPESVQYLTNSCIGIKS